MVDSQTAHAFLLRCRLAFDWMHAGAAELSVQHRHYRFLIDQLTCDEQATLQQLVIANHRIDYVTARQHACARLSAEQLLELFTL